MLTNAADGPKVSQEEDYSHIIKAFVSSRADLLSRCHSCNYISDLRSAALLGKQLIRGLLGGILLYMLIVSENQRETRANY